MLPGCDGLKTGYIDESGYNLSLTAQRGGTRFLSVTMRGPGNNAAEGQAGRVHDGNALMEWAFYSFADFSIAESIHPYFIKNYGTKQKSFNLIPLITDEMFTVPFISGNTMNENLSKVQVEVLLPPRVLGTVVQGAALGSVKISLDGYLLQEIPLIADRTTFSSSWFVRLADRIVILLS